MKEEGYIIDFFFKEFVPDIHDILIIRFNFFWHYGLKNFQNSVRVLKLTLSKIIYFAIQCGQLKCFPHKLLNLLQILVHYYLTGNNSFIKLVWIGMNQDKLKVSLNVKLNN